MTVRLLVTTARGGAINRSTFDEKQWKPALAKAGVIEAPEVTVVPRPGKPVLRRVKWSMPREDGFHVLSQSWQQAMTVLGRWLSRGRGELVATGPAAGESAVVDLPAVMALLADLAAADDVPEWLRGRVDGLAANTAVPPSPLEVETPSGLPQRSRQPVGSP